MTGGERTRALAASVLVVGLVAALTVAAGPARGAGGAGRRRVTAPAVPATPEGETHCGACHLVEGWQKVRFNHDPTGFPLRGAHLDVTCTGCHTKTFDTPVTDTCAGCHRDRHGGELGLHCEGCHDAQSWRPLFQADAHRRSAFPLVGKHALIPCTECHGNLRDRTFTRAASRCDACHAADFVRAAATSIDHMASNYSRECQTCHNTLRFFPASVRAHDSCFRINGGPHQPLRCLNCHTSLPTAVFSGTCATGSFTCSECHTHTCAHSEQQHKNVMGYQCTNGKCYECHKLGAL